MKRHSIISMFIFILMISFSTMYGQKMMVKKEKKIKMKGSGTGIGLVIMSKKSDHAEEKEKGVKIIKVLPDSPAEKAGFNKDDMIIGVNGKSITSIDEIGKIFDDLKLGDEVSLEILREGKKQTIKVKVEKLDMDKDMHAFTWTGDGMEEEIIRLPHSPESAKGGFLGVKAENLTDQLKEYFGVTHGVLVKEVIKESPAEKAGLKAGDVITQIESRKVMDYADLVRFLNYYDPDNKISVTIVRKEKEKKIKVTLGKKKTMHMIKEKLGALPAPEKKIIMIDEHDDISTEFEHFPLKWNEKGEKEIEIKIIII
ncbi:MAG: hypothetical protein Kow00108_12730 [Calditrichia bacterium]